MTDEEFLKNIDNEEFCNALIKCFPNGIPENVKEPIIRGYCYLYDAGAVCDDLHGCTEYPN